MYLLTMNNSRIMKNLINNCMKIIECKIHSHGLFIFISYFILFYCIEPTKLKRKGKKKVNRRKETNCDLAFWSLVCLCLILMHPQHQFSFSFLP